MNKLALASVAIVGVFVAGGAYVVQAKKNNDKQTASLAQKMNQPTTMSASGSTSTQKGSYVDYTPSVIASTANTKILFFHASWCPQCRSIDADIKSKGAPQGTTIIKVDYDTNQALRKKYGVTLQTTLVRVDDQGNIVEKFVAYDDPTLASIVKNLL